MTVCWSNCNKKRKKQSEGYGLTLILFHRGSIAGCIQEPIPRSRSSDLKSSSFLSVASKLRTRFGPYRRWRPVHRQEWRSQGAVLSRAPRPGHESLSAGAFFLRKTTPTVLNSSQNSSQSRKPSCLISYIQF